MRNSACRAKTVTAGHVGLISSQIDVNARLGLRDRAIVETLYSTAMRCSDLCNLNSDDFSPERDGIAIR